MQITSNEESFAEAFHGNPSVEGLSSFIESGLGLTSKVKEKQTEPKRNNKRTSKRRYVPITALQRQVLWDQRFNLRLERQKLILELKNMRRCNLVRTKSTQTVHTNGYSNKQTQTEDERIILADLSDRNCISFNYV